MKSSPAEAPARGAKTKSAAKLASLNFLPPKISARLQDWLDRAKEHSLWRLETALVVGAVFCGLVSGLLNKVHQEASEQSLREIYRTDEAYVAATDLSFGIIIDQTHLRRTSLLAANLSPNVLRPRNVNLILGKRLAIDLKAGDPLMLTAVQGTNDVSGLSEKIPPGKRLFTLTVDDNAAARGFIRPNDHVDVLTHVELPNRGKTTFTVLQDVTLVTVGSTTVLDARGKTAATDVSFFIDAKDIELLAYAQKHGQFSLSLRNPTDVSRTNNNKGVDLNDFLDNDHINSASGGGVLEVTEKGKAVHAPRKN